MLTRCPDCATRYRVGPEHLQVAGGRVRCGRCGQVFNALGQRIEGAALAASSGLALAVPSPKTGLGPDLDPVPRRSRGLWWGLGALLLTVTLVLQVAWWERDTLAADPRLLSLLLPICRHLPCALSPPRDPARIEVLSRSLEADPSRPGVLHFRLRMVSRSPHVQPFPLLELRLLDAAEQTVGLRRFTPTEYLPGGAPPSGLLAPDRPVDARLDLLDPKARMQGFQIDFL
jgi:predicted Zn finger-like uncharacterized protein